MRTSERTGPDWFENLRDDFNAVLPDLIAGKPDRIGLVNPVRRVAKGPLTVGEVIGAVAAETRIAAAEITGARQTARVVPARRMAMSLACELIPALSHDQIAGNFNRTQHLVPLALAGVRLLLKKDPDFAHCYQRVRWRLGLA